MENDSYDVDIIPELSEGEAQKYSYCVFDAGDEEFADYFWLPPVFLESFTAPALCLQLGPYQVQMPSDWAIVTTDEDLSSLEVLPLTSPYLHKGDRVTPIFNPLKSWMPRVEVIEITNAFQDVKWFFPKLKFGHVLVVPLEDGPEPKCAMFVKDVNKIKNLEFADIL